MTSTTPKTLVIDDPAYHEHPIRLLLRLILPVQVPMAFIKQAVRLQRPMLRARYPMYARVRAPWGITGSVSDVRYSPRGRSFMYVISYGLGGTSEADATETALTPYSGRQQTPRSQVGAGRGPNAARSKLNPHSPAATAASL